MRTDPKTYTNAALGQAIAKARSTLATAEREPELADPLALADLRHRLRALEGEALRRGYEVIA
jgi:hypothetical protein